MLPLRHLLINCWVMGITGTTILFTERLAASSTPAEWKITKGIIYALNQQGVVGGSMPLRCRLLLVVLFFLFLVV